MTVPHWRRGDVTREADLVEEVARIWGSRSSRHAALAPRRAAGGSSRSSGCAAGPRTRWSAPALRDPRLELRRARPAPTGCRLAPDDPRARRGAARATRCPRTSRCCARRCSGSLLDNARAQPRARHEDVRLWEYGAVYLAREAGGGNGAGPPAVPGLDRLPEERQHLGALLTGDLRPPTWREPEPPRRGLLRRQGRARRGAGRPARAVGGRAGARAVPAPRPLRRACSSAASRPAGSASCIPRSRRAGTSSRPRASSSTSASLAEPRCSCPTTRTSPRSRPCARTSRSSCPTTCRPRRSSPSCARPAARCCARAEVFDVYRGAQVGEGSASLALRLEFRARDRTLTDEEAAAAAREDRRRARRAARRASCVAEVARPRRVRLRRRDRGGAAVPPPGLRAHARHRALRGGRAPRPRSTRARACRSCSRTATSDVHGDVDAALVVLPARRRRAGRGGAARARRAGSSTCRPTSGCATATSTRTGTAPHGAPELFGCGVYGLPELYRDEVRGRRPRRQPRLLSDRGAARRSRRWRARG